MTIVLPTAPSNTAVVPSTVAAPGVVDAFVSAAAAVVVLLLLLSLMLLFFVCRLLRRLRLLMLLGFFLADTLMRRRGCSLRSPPHDLLPTLSGLPVAMLLLMLRVGGVAVMLGSY